MMSLLLKRKSIRSYTNQEVTDEVIDTLLVSAMQAPSACNQQPWEFIVIDDLDTLEKLSTISKGAWMLKDVTKAIAVIMTDTTSSPSMRAQDCAAATQNILLEATNQNLGACWIGIHPKEDRQPIANEMLNVPKGKDVFSLISLGYPKEEKDVKLRFDPSRVYKNRY